MKFISKSIRRKLLFAFLLSIAIPILFSSTILYLNTRSVVKEETIKEAEQLFRKGKMNINFYFDLINKASLTIYKTKYREKTLYAVINKEYDYDTERFVLQVLNSIYEFDDDIFQIYLYLETVQKSFLVKEDLMSQMDTSEGYVKESLLGDAYITSVQSSTNYGIPHMIKSNENVISFCRNLYDIPSDERVGQLVIDLSADVLDRLCSNLYDSKTDQFYLVNLQDQKAIYSSESQMISQDLLEKATKSIEQEIYNFDWKDDSFSGICVVDVIRKPYMQLLLVKRIPGTVITKEVNPLVEFVGIISIITIGMIIVVSIVISYYFTRPINDLLDTIDIIRKGNLSTTIEIKGEDEFGKLKEHFNEMMESINEHITYEYKLGMENTLNELRALQAQINSHFMNNILQSIGTEALKSGSPKVYRLIVQLGSMMQYSMRNQNQIVTLSAELEYCKNFLELQRHRFDGNFEYWIETSDDVVHIPIPKVTLQPIIENCFIHGILENQDMGFVRVRCYTNNRRMIIEVEDNGVGMTVEETDQLNQSFKGLMQQEAIESIGLKNVYKRLYFYYQGEAKIEVYPNVKKGITVRLEIPFGTYIEGGSVREDINC